MRCNTRAARLVQNCTHVLQRIENAAAGSLMYTHVLTYTHLLLVHSCHGKSQIGQDTELPDQTPTWTVRVRWQ